MLRKYWQIALAKLANMLGFEVNRSQFDTRRRLDLVLFGGLGVLTFLAVVIGWPVVAAVLALASAGAAVAAW